MMKKVTELMVPGGTSIQRCARMICRWLMKAVGSRFSLATQVLEVGTGPRVFSGLRIPSK